MEITQKFVDEPSSLEGTEANQIKYIEKLLEIVKEDKIRIMQFILLNLTTIAFLLSQILSKIQGNLMILKIMFTLSLLSLSTSALFYYLYWHKLHTVSMQIIRCIPSVQIYRARELWAGEFGVWKKFGAMYKYGNKFLIIAIFLLLIMIILFLFLDTTISCCPK